MHHFSGHSGTPAASEAAAYTEPRWHAPALAPHPCHMVTSGLSRVVVLVPPSAQREAHAERQAEGKALQGLIHDPRLSDRQIKKNRQPTTRLATRSGHRPQGVRCAQCHCASWSPSELGMLLSAATLMFTHKRAPHQSSSLCSSPSRPSTPRTLPAPMGVRDQHRCVIVTGRIDSYSVALTNSVCVWLGGGGLRG